MTSYLAIVACLITTVMTTTLAAERITVSGTNFIAGGETIYLNGVNTPWDHWNDFGGASGWNNYDNAWWDAEFTKLAAAGVNACRVWITCDGDNDGFIYADGKVTGMTAQFWSDCDALMALAAEHEIYIMASLISFDHTNANRPNANIWRSVMNDLDSTQACIDNYIVPFAERYENDPWLYAIDLCNEIEWMNQNSIDGNIPWANLQRYVARAAAAIHATDSEVLVTMGTASVKWHSDEPGFEGNYWDDAALQAQFNNPGARLDFYQLHYYDWMYPFFGAPNHDRSPADYGLTDRPVVVGEMPITPSAYGGSGTSISVLDSFEYMYNAGYAGHFPWESTATGGANGAWSEMESAATTFAERYIDTFEPTTRRITIDNLTGYNWQETDAASTGTDSGSTTTFDTIEPTTDLIFAPVTNGDT